ncbi:MAG: hypothetical protein ABI851_06610 [Saprospiraceae bacterium]
MKYLPIILVFGFLCFVSCKKSPKSAAVVDRTANLTPLPPAIITQLNNNCTSIDIIPLRKEANASLSFSKNESQALQYMISFISDEKGFIGNCTPDGHIVFGENGEINYEADIYFSGGCSSFAWIKGGKIIYINKIRPEGAEFFRNFIKPISKEKMDSFQRMK